MGLELLGKDALLTSCRILAGSVKVRNYSTASTASKQSQPAPTGTPVPGQGSTKGTQPASQPPTEGFSYHAFPHPLQDTSNLPSAHGQRPASAPLHKQLPGHTLRQHDQPSRSSSDCFSMDPAQLEADIAALTHAIAAESAPAGTAHRPDQAERDRSHVRHVISKKGTTQHDTQYQKQATVGCEMRMWDSEAVHQKSGWYQGPQETLAQLDGEADWSDSR